MSKMMRTPLSEYIKQALSAKTLLLSLAVSSTLVPISSVAAATEASADEEVERLLVTGSRRNDRTVSESTVPVDILNAEDLASTGQMEVSQILANLIPSFNYPNSAVADGTDHARPAVLRGLAPDHTLVLINGKRRHSGALLNLNGTVGRGSTAVDLNNIPTSAIKSIEILRDGAAAQYGSDAIAGVINIILKNEEGGSITATYGKYDTTMDGVAQLESTSIDENGDLAFTTGDDRSRTDGGTTTIAGDWGFNLADKGFLHLSFESRNRNPTNRSGFDPREQYARDENGDLDPRELSFDRYNHSFGKSDVQDLAFFYNMAYQLGEETEFYSFGSFGDREGLSPGFYRRAQDSRNLTEVYPDGFLPHISSKVKDQSLVVGLRGDTQDWEWDVSATHGKNDFNFGVENSLNTSMGVTSPTQFDNGHLIYQQTVLNFDASRMFDWGWYDDVFLAVGAEYRNENYQITPGEEASYLTVLDDEGNPVASGGAQVLAGFSPASAVDKSRHNVAVFFELDTDLSENLNTTVAGRFEDYSDFGTNFTAKFASRYEINEKLAFRGAISSGFRAPSLAQTSFTSVATVFENGVPNEVGIFPVDNAASVALGAEQLTAEESVNMTFGFVYEQDNFNLTVDAYRITIDDRIVLSENLSGDAVVEILQAAGELNTQRARYFTNAIDTTTKGIDIVATYDYELDNLGSLRFSSALNLNDTEVTHVKDNPEELSALGDDYVLFSEREILRFERGTPKNKLNLAAIWNYNDLQVTLRSTRYGEVSDVSNDPENHEVLDPNWITDLDFSYALTDNLDIAFGANNLFDDYPQDTVSNIGTSTFNQIFPYSGFSAYSFDGRFIYGRISYSF